MNVKSAVVLTACAVAMAGIGDTGYSYDPSDPQIYIATVPAGETNEISSAAADVLNGGGITNFVKKGEGTLVSNLDITSYTGGILVEDGVFRSVPNVKENDTVGKLSGGGDIWVLDGATMEIYSPSIYSTHMSGKTTHIAGRGFGGRGALVSRAGTINQASATFGNVKLEADALVCNEGDGNSGNIQFYIAVNGSTLDFNSHVLYLGGVGEVAFNGKPTFPNLPSNSSAPKDFIVSEGYGVKFSGGSSSSAWNNWHTAVGIALTNTTRLIFDNCYMNNFNWPVKMHPGTGIHVRGDSYAWSPTSPRNVITASGIVYLLDPDRNWVQFNTSGNFLQIKGKLTGGGLQVKTFTPGSQLYLSNKNNDFTNGIVATSCSVHAITNGALPAAGAALSLTNAYAVFHSSETYSLPPLMAHGNCAVTNHVGASPSGAWRDAVTKTGSGTLRYATLIGAPRLDVRGGTVKLESVGGALPVFGTLGGSREGTIDFGGESYSISGICGSPCVTNCPTLTVASSWSIDASSLDGFGGGLATDGSLAFSSGVVLSVENSDVIAPGRRQRGWVLATADEGIVGMPGVASNVRGWSVVKSGDGKTLTLLSPPVGFKMVLR